MVERPAAGEPANGPPLEAAANLGAPDPDDLEAAGLLVERARVIVALTGAGISTEAGIPDFRGPAGLWTRNPSAERTSDIGHWLSDPELRRRAWRDRVDAPVWSARPTAGHLALVDLERRGKLETIVTQNTDGLHQLAGSAPDRVVEVHGTSHWTVCWECGARQRTATVLDRVRGGDDDPRCEVLIPPAAAAAAARGTACGGILKTATVSFGQSLDPAVLERAQQAAARADLMIAIGTTLEVQPVAGIVPLARRMGAAIVIVNGSPTALDALADVVVRGRIGDVLPALLGA